MTAQTILASNRAVTIVLEVRTDNTKVIPASYSDWVGGPSMLAYPLGVTVEDNSLLYLSTGAVAGLAYNEVVFSDFFVERSLAAPFTGGGGLSINGLPNAPSFAGLDIFVAGDDLELYARDWENKPFTLYVGYEGDDWANFEVYFTGKTIGHSLINDGIQVDLSLNPTGTDKLFPVNRFDDGRVKPYVFGAVKNIKPVKVNPDADDGLWRFHDGTVGTTDTEWAALPYCVIDFERDIYAGIIDFQLFDAAVLGVDVDEDSLYDSSTATNALPDDISTSTGAVSVESDHILVTLPNQDSPTTFPDECRISLQSEAALAGLNYDIEIDISLDDSSTVDSFQMSGFYSNYQNKTITRSVQTYKRLNNITTSYYSYKLQHSWLLYKNSSQNSETIKLRIYGARLIPRRISGADVQAFNASSATPSGFSAIPTYRVADVLAHGQVPNFVSIYDDTGLIRVDSENTDFVMKAVGDTTNNDLVAACQYISTQANGSDSPVTSSITSPTVGVYCDKAKPIVEWWREWCDAVDVYLDVSLTTSTTDLKRRFNNQVFDADGVLNVTDSFSFTEDDMLTFKQLANEASVSQYEVSYKYNHERPKDSPTATNINPFARLNQVKRIDTVLVNQSDATVVAELNNRDGNKRSFYEFEVAGAGHGLSPNDTGFISHSKIKDGKFTLRFVREYPLQKKTLLKGVKNG